MKAAILIFALFLSTAGAAQPKSYTIVFLNIRSEAEKIDTARSRKLMEGHMANINRLAEEGKLLAAGPFHGGGGLFILNTTSIEEAQSWVSSDPAVQANRWNIELLPYTPRVGGICPVSEPYEMVSYSFVRFNAIVDKFTAPTYPAIIRQHEAFLKEKTQPLGVVTEAIFGPNEGGILIVRDELDPDAFSKDPGVQQGLLDVEVKKLYIARTSFCEK